MKIGIIIGSLGLGGAERVSVRLGKWFIDKGHDVVYFTTKPVPPKEYPLPIGAERTACKGTGFKLIKNIRNAIKENKPNVIVVMDTPMCVYAVPAIIGTNVPFVVSERSAPNNARIKKLTRIISRAASSLANYFIFQTTGAQKCYSRSVQKKSCVIPNPLVLEELPEPYHGERDHRFVAVGRLIKEKNYPLAINAFVGFHVAHDDYRLEIYGDGPEKERIQAIIHQHNAESFIVLMGACSDVLERIKTAAAFVLSSDLEGMPNALLEAMALGLPCISTDCPSGGPHDLVEDGVNGLLVSVNDVNATEHAMSVIVSDKQLSGRISSTAIQIRDRLDINTVGAMWLNVLERVAK